MGWIGSVVLVLAISGLVGRYLSRFREYCSEMSGMMLGMTMGMLNGLVLGYAAAAASDNMFWGNAFGIVCGLTLGAYYGRAGGLMGVLDGAMGGVMGGSMGAMLAIMVRFPAESLLWTAVLLALVYALGMSGLVVLIERSAPHLAILHQRLPWLLLSAAAVPPAAPATVINYYEMLDIAVRADSAAIATAYLAYIDGAGEEASAVAATALATLSSPTSRARYDRDLARASGRGECCPPPGRGVAAAAVPASPTAPRLAPTAAKGAATTPRRLADYYALLGVQPDAHHDEIVEAYLARKDGADDAASARLERAITMLSDRERRQEYDRLLAANRAELAAAGAAGGLTERQNAATAGRTRAEGADRRTSVAPPVGAAARRPWTLALLLLAALFGVAALLGVLVNRDGATPASGVTTDANLLALAVPAPVGADGVQTLALTVNGDTMSYDPSLIRVQQGVPVRFHLSVEGRDPG